MIILITLLLILFISLMAAKRSYNDHIEFLGTLIAIVSVLYLIFHILLWSFSSVNYNLFVTRRQAFAETLERARQDNNSLELASISREISEFNQILAQLKYENSLFFLQDYVDDRFMDLEPIR
jgi:predicted ferric reductase